MDRLTDKQTKEYAALSRYASLPIYYDTLEDKYVYGLMKSLDNTTDYTLHTLKSEDTLNSLALFYYGRPDYYWIIANFNRINPFIKLTDKFTKIKIPSLSYIQFVGNLYVK